MPARVVVRVIGVPTNDWAGTWGPIVARAEKRITERQAQAVKS
jgi:hypothetical protein